MLTHGNLDGWGDHLEETALIMEDTLVTATVKTQLGDSHIGFPLSGGALV